MPLRFAFLLLFVSHSTFAQRYDVVFHEIFPDPTPSVGLPNYEWIELRNRSTQPVSLLGWRLQDAGGQSAPFPNITLLPDSLMIVCSTTAASQLNYHGRCMGILGFPSLDNEGELLVLKNANGQVIHAVSYSIDWHSTALKKDGGWSIEMIDAQHPGVFAANWNSSTHPRGGTPGKSNSIERRIEDRDPPTFINAYVLDSSNLILQFDEGLDSAAVSSETWYQLSDGRTVTNAHCQPPLYDRLILRTDWPLLNNKAYTLSWREIADLSGNKTISTTTARIGIPVMPDSQDIRINEILFDPPSGGCDYVELLNTGKKIIDLSKIYLSTRGISGSLGSIKPVCLDPKYVFPGDHIVLTVDPVALSKSYFVSDPSMVIETDALPSLPDTEGSLVVLNAPGIVVDELRYAADWHFPLLQMKTGIALERIDPNSKTQDRNNWQSAASTVGYGTPTRRNSQYRLFNGLQQLEYSSFILSPDGDGKEDVVQMRYKTDKPDNRIRIRIFHSGGVPVRELANMVLNGNESLFTWNGLDDRGRPLPTGQYIILTEIYQLDGKRTIEKKVVNLVCSRR